MSPNCRAATVFLSPRSGGTVPHCTRVSSATSIKVSKQFVVWSYMIDGYCKVRFPQKRIKDISLRILHQDRQIFRVPHAKGQGQKKSAIQKHKSSILQTQIIEMDEVVIDPFGQAYVLVEVAFSGVGHAPELVGVIGLFKYLLPQSIVDGQQVVGRLLQMINDQEI